MVNFSPQGQVEYDAKVLKFKQDLEHESDLIEAQWNAGGHQEVTAQHVSMAASRVRAGLVRARRGKPYGLAVVASPAAGVLGGWGTNQLDSTAGLLAVIGAIVMIFGAESFKIWKDSR
ncbi:hypothetical protein ASD42_24920 [Nocardia sp. Root136]|nr:hypothetical protein ASD42_24920 [Nocardia sp. Root136]